MNIRLVGSIDQIERLAKLIPGASVRPSRKAQHQKLLYLDVDARVVERLLQKLEKNEPINLRSIEGE